MYLEDTQYLKFREIWAIFESKIINEIGSEINGRNLCQLAMNFSNSKQGSLDFWKFLNLKLIVVEKELTIRDISQISQSFSKVNLMDTDKFTSIISRAFQRSDIEKDLTLLDLAQIVSTCKYQKVKRDKIEQK